MPIIPKIRASYSTFLLICLGVVPIDASIPYCLTFSVIDMLKLFFIQYAEIRIIIIKTTIATVYNICAVWSLSLPNSIEIKL